MEISHSPFPHKFRQHTIIGLSEGQISLVLGFAPAEEDPDAVPHVWDFHVDGVLCSVWSYKGSERHGWWSAFGPRDTLIAVFGGEHIR